MRGGLLGLLIVCVVFAAPVFTSPLLSAYAPKQAPWINLQAGSNQIQPIYIGATPWEMVNGKTASEPQIWINTRALGEDQINVVINAMYSASTSSEIPEQLQLEVWPAYDDYTGQQTWAIARYKQPDPKSDWQFIEVDLPDPNFNISTTVVIQVPLTYRPWNETENDLIFDDFTQFDDLYEKPLFGNCIFAQEDNGDYTGGFIKEAWLDPSDYNRNAKRSEITDYDANTKSPDRIVCRMLPQPSRFNNQPITFVVTVDLKPFNSTYIQTSVTWPSGIDWISLPSDLPPQPTSLTPQITSWPTDFIDSWKQDILWLDGEDIATFPISGKKVRFSHKNAADPESRLGVVFDWLAERYEAMAIGAELHPMRWVYRNISEMNLVVVLPGSDRLLPPVLVADHVDTAYCEDIFDATGKRVSNPGADDNGSAVATLIKTAEILGNPKKHKRDIWLVHITGEEYPSDDMGVRHLIMNLLAEKRPIKGMVLMDMISWRANSSDRIFQINAGASTESLELAKYAYEVSRYINNYTATPIEAAFRWRFDDFSYLYNTDGICMSDNGFPVILLNEHINGYQNFDRPYYHTSKDLVKTLDLAYGTAVAKVAIETVAHLANS